MYKNSQTLDNFIGMFKFVFAHVKLKGLPMESYGAMSKKANQTRENCK